MGPTSHLNDQPVGVVGPVPEQVSAVLEHTEASTIAGTGRDVVAADPGWIIAVGETSVLELTRAGVNQPMLPIAAGRGLASVPKAKAKEAVKAVLAGDATEDSRRLLTVAVDGESTTALFDVMLITAEPAQISEYAIQTRETLVASFRADGVVVATPAGSTGYATDVGGPTVDAGTDVGPVIPVAPFVTDANHWVLDLSDVRIDIVREDSVNLIVDDQEWRAVTPGETVHLGLGEHVPFLLVPESQGFADGETGLEKL